MAESGLVIDASAMVDLVLGRSLAEAIRGRIDGVALHAPAHLDAEVLSALGRLHRDGQLSASIVARQVEVVADAPVQRHHLPGLLAGAWRRRDRLRLADALYVELATELGIPLVTTDARLGRAVRIAEVVTA